MNVEKQKEVMNGMLNYLGRDTYSIRYNKDYETVTLTYSKNTSILTKKIEKWDYNGNLKEQSEKEKALGGHNGDSVFKSLKNRTLETIEKKVLKTAIRNELTEHGLDYEDLDA